MSGFAGNQRSIGSRVTLVAATLAVVFSAACATASGSSGTVYRTHVDLRTLTHDQLLSTNFTNAYDAVEALRSNWLQVRTNTVFGGGGNDVAVYLDNIRLGGVAELQGIALRPIAYIRYYDAVEATQRWGLDHTQGVIFVSTHRE